MKQEWIRDCLILLIGGGLIAGLFLSLETQPGYMDAEYYYVMAKLIYAGRGASEPFIWNYINNPTNIPVPSFSYWMPFTSFVAFVGMLLGRNTDWNSGRILFFALAAGVPVLTYAMGWVISQKRQVAWLAGMLAWFPVYYAPYLVTTDAFVIYMVLGTIWILLIKALLDENKDMVVLLGLVSGLMHLTRADGLIWFCLLMILLLIKYLKGGVPRKIVLLVMIKALCGYLLVMGGWYLRNYFQYGNIFPPGNQRLLWLNSYDEIFIYPPSQLTFGRWIDGGIHAILLTRLNALIQNLLSFLAVQCEIFLLPLLVWGLKSTWNKRVYGTVLSVWCVLLILMSFIFPFAGYRGGFFHAVSAFQPFIWGVSAAGMVSFVEWGVRVRGWNYERAWKVFSISGIILSFVLTVFVSYNRIVGNNPKGWEWTRSAEQYRQICRRLNELDLEDESAVMINNPVGFYLTCQKPAIVIPAGGEEALRAVSDVFNARYLVLEEHLPKELDLLYHNPSDFPDYRLIFTQDEWKIFQTVLKP